MLGVAKSIAQELGWTYSSYGHMSDGNGHYCIVQWKGSYILIWESSIGKAQQKSWRREPENAKETAQFIRDLVAQGELR